MAEQLEGAKHTPLDYMRKQIRLFETIAINKLGHAVRTKDTRRLLPFAQKILSFCQETYEQLLKMAPDPKLACRKGCGICCHNHIELNPLFAFYVYHHLKETKQVQEWEAIRCALKDEENCCPLLHEEVCSIYPARPPVCRGWYSEDVTLCEERDFCAPQHHYKADKAYGSQHYMVFLYVLEKRLQAIEKHFGLDCKDVYLKDALKRLDACKDSLEHWISAGTFSLV